MPDEANLPEAVRQDEETHYHFPVEVVVVGELSESDKQSLLDQVWKELEAAVV
jgi:hypothetical protein